MQKKFIIRAIGLGLSGLLAAGVATAADQKPAKGAEVAVNVQGVQVAIDPVTGHLVAPTAAQRAALSRAMLERAASSEPRPRLGRSAIPRNEAEARATFRIIRLKNGRQAVGMDVPENLMSSLVAERRADGRLNIHHEGDANQAHATEVSQ